MSSPVRRWALASALLAPFAVIGGWTLAATRQPRGYSSVRDTISALAGHAATDRWIMTTGLVLLGLCHLVTAAGLRSRPHVRTARARARWISHPAGCRLPTAVAGDLSGARRVRDRRVRQPRDVAGLRSDGARPAGPACRGDGVRGAAYAAGLVRSGPRHSHRWAVGANAAAARRHCGRWSSSSHAWDMRGIGPRISTSV